MTEKTVSEVEYAGYTIKLKVHGFTSVAYIYDSEGDEIAHKDSIQDATDYIFAKIDREGKKEMASRKKLGLKVITEDSYKRKGNPLGVLDRIHGGTGQVIVSGHQHEYEFYPDVVRVRTLRSEIAEIGAKLDGVKDQLAKYKMEGRRKGYGRGSVDVEALEAALVEEYEKKAAL